MHFEGRETINVPIQAAWAFLLDPQNVAACAPGYQDMEILGPDQFKPRVAVGVGAVKATFTLDVLLTDLRAPEHAGMQAHGIAAGSAVDVQSALDLIAESASVTAMVWSMDVDVRGSIAGMGARLLEGTARKLTTKFFDCVRQHMETPASAPAT
jgi:carbon monoxide dehydrogenase subunit G